MRAAVIGNLAALAGLEAAWWDLIARVPAATPFAAPAWLMPWWRSFAPGELFVVTMTDGDRLVGLAPLYVEHGPSARRLLPLGIGASDMLDILVDPDHAAAVGRLLGDVLHGERARYDLWAAEEAPPGAAVLALPDPPGWHSAVEAQSACPVLHLTPDLRGAIPARKWRKWQMARNRAARRGWSITAASPGDAEEALAQLFRLHAARWESRGEAGVLADERVRAFHRDAAPALLAAGLLHLTTLRIDGTVAGVCHVLRRGMAYAYCAGFDPAFAFESPGTLLIGAAIESAAREGAPAFSFLRGQEAYKYEWGAVDCWNRRRIFVPAA